MATSSEASSELEAWEYDSEVERVVSDPLCRVECPESLQLGLRGVVWRGGGMELCECGGVEGWSCVKCGGVEGWSTHLLEIGS